MQLACRNFHTLERPETKRKEPLQDFGCFGGGVGARRGDNVSRALCAHCAVFYSLLHHHHHHRTSADTCAEGGKKRCSKSILKGIHEYGCQGPSAPLLVIARSPPLSLTISRTPTPPPSYPLFLSFNLRLDCRLHILPLRPRSLSQLPFGLLSLLLSPISLLLSLLSYAHFFHGQFLSCYFLSLFFFFFNSTFLLRNCRNLEKWTKLKLEIYSKSSRNR